jgi:hypothetical protein
VEYLLHKEIGEEDGGQPLHYIGDLPRENVRVHQIEEPTQEPRISRWPIRCRDSIHVISVAAGDAHTSLVVPNPVVHLIGVNEANPK